jgi:glycosyltransferase involved in cell wall biosynthesis
MVDVHSVQQRAPQVSVLLPFRDAEATLEEALSSVLAQRGPTLELLAVDDGSTDGSLALARRLAALDRRVQLLDGAGRGLVAALNLAASAARAPLLARMDADDVALPGRLAAQHAAFERDEPGRQAALGALGTGVELFPDEHVGEGMRHYVAWQNALLSPEEHRRQLYVEAPLCHPSTMLRAAALRAVGGYRDGDFPEDYDLWLRLDAAGFALAKLPEVLLRWRRGPHAATARDARYHGAPFPELKAPFLAARLREHPARPVDVWGAGQTGRRLARALEPSGVRAARFLDIDPLKIGRSARGAPIVAVDALAPPGERWVVVALGVRGARDLARIELLRRGYREGDDFLCAA